MGRHAMGSYVLALPFAQLFVKCDQRRSSSHFFPLMRNVHFQGARRSVAVKP